MKTAYTAEEIISETTAVCNEIVGSDYFNWGSTKSVQTQILKSREIGQVFMMFKGDPEAKALVKRTVKEFAKPLEGGREDYWH